MARHIGIFNSSISSPPSSVATSSATNITSVSMTLNGSVTNAGHLTSLAFEYGTSNTLATFTTVTATPSSVSDSSTTSISAGISGLSGNTIYYYRVAATTGDVITRSSIASATTLQPFPTVTGGTLTSDATYYYRTFTSNGNFIVSNASLTVDVTYVGGGGGGSANNTDNQGLGGRYNGAPGGGGSGVNTRSGIVVSPSTNAIVIGAGGAGASQGSISTAFGFQSGKGFDSGVVMAYDGNVIFGPGTATELAGYCGPGGGGAAANGQDAFAYYTNSISQGGAGSSTWSGTKGAGGQGGTGFYGAGGSQRVPAREKIDGPANSGNGGSGRSWTNNFVFDQIGAGGSGIIIIRYLRSLVGG